ncbi:hypothetical protein [Acutalibacter caecimuris]|uniref:hypothetical protein n=1 Tax=Acutalibacter caecimuris TaxID=3093657 RepID=UPI002AC8E9C3|nr:hypothetical protein [Acutalibacter sp. M00118]
MPINQNKTCRALALALSFALIFTAHQALAATGSPGPSLEPVRLETTIFLGQAVPLRHQGLPLEEALRQALGNPPGLLEAFYVSPTGLLPLEELGRYRPCADEDIKLSVVLYGKGGRDTWKNLTYRVNVAGGTVRVLVDAAGLGPESQGLFRLEGQGLALYRQAVVEADPQGGPPRLEAVFSGLPYGVYRVTAMSGGQAQTARLGVCETDDTISTARAETALRFGPLPGGSETAGESYRLGVQP